MSTFTKSQWLCLSPWEELLDTNHTGRMQLSNNYRTGIHSQSHTEKGIVYKFLYAIRKVFFLFGFFGFFFMYVQEKMDLSAESKALDHKVYWDAAK